MKEYFAAWDKKYYEEGGTEIQPLSWFNEDRGYNPEDLAKIEALEIGESIEMEPGHIIVRVS